MNVDQYWKPKPQPYSDEFKNLADAILSGSDSRAPKTAEEALAAYTLIIETVNADLADE